MKSFSDNRLIPTLAARVCDNQLVDSCKMEDQNCPYIHLAPNSYYYDAHCHLDRLKKNNQVELHHLALPKQLAGIITNFIDPHLYARLPDILDADFAVPVYGTAGVHPQHAAKFNEKLQVEVVNLLTHPKILAIGECGLDQGHLNKATIQQQETCFRWQLEAAKKYHKPLVLHCKNMHEEMLEIAQQVLDERQKITVHCFGAVP